MGCASHQRASIEQDAAEFLTRLERLTERAAPIHTLPSAADMLRYDEVVSAVTR